MFPETALARTHANRLACDDAARRGACCEDNRAGGRERLAEHRCVRCAQQRGIRLVRSSVEAPLLLNAHGASGHDANHVRRPDTPSRAVIEALIEVTGRRERDEARGPPAHPRSRDPVTGEDQARPPAHACRADKRERRCRSDDVNSLWIEALAREPAFEGAPPGSCDHTPTRRVLDVERPRSATKRTGGRAESRAGEGQARHEQNRYPSRHAPKIGRAFTDGNPLFG